MSEIGRIKQMLKSKRKPEPAIKPTDYLSTGSTVLNLACSGKRSGGFLKGRYFFLVGDSASGKSFLSLTCFAEATKNKEFDGYRLIYDDAEGGALMDIQKFFGSKTAQRMETLESVSIEDFYDNVDNACEDGRPFIYVLDSMDSLTSEAEDEKFKEQKAARAKGKDTAGSYGDGKAKKNSAGIRRLIPRLRQSGSILIIISQTRDNIGFGAQFDPKTRSGGRALRFYAALELWSSIKGRIKRPVKGQQRQVGILCEIKVKKNRLTGKERTVEIPIYASTGIDDTGANVNFLVKEGHWPGKENTVTAPEFKFKGSKEKLIAQIESEGREKELKMLVGKCWQEIESACEVVRKSRYS